ncbi:acid phosphatase det1 [Dermatophagoides farinae]|uniref:Acid phosphatase det1 n=1 Tax=Dermatophagoides farinae TaxID=6954 RepID=A0A922HY01_DERFA|nr:acid phosphatase det1 [Dermatophagoides farinae]
MQSMYRRLNQPIPVSHRPVAAFREIPFNALKHRIITFAFLQAFLQNDHLTEKEIEGIFFVIGLLIFNVITAQSLSTNEKVNHLGRDLLELNIFEQHGNDSSTIHELDLSNQLIHTIQSGVFNHTKNLKILNLSHNQLKVINRNWLTISLANLVRLILRKNQITEIGLLAFDNLRSLRFLDLRHNHLGNLLDGTFWGLNRVERLYLDHNHITTIRYGWTYGMQSLKILSMEFNQIDSIELEAFKSFSRRLLRLNLHSNRLQQITTFSLINLNQLERLDLSNNSIKKIEPRSFYSLKKLQFLDLSMNKLSNVFNEDGELFIGMESLKDLRLNSNHIEKIGVNTFFDLHSLITLNISSNPIQMIEQESLDHITNVENLYIENINLTCDCQVEWLHFWLKLLSPDIRERIATQLQCSRPIELRGEKSFMNIDPFNLLCLNNDMKFEKNDHDKILPDLDESVLHPSLDDKLFKKSDMAPHFDYEPSNITGELGKSVHIECPARAISAPNISLSRYDKQLKFVAAIERRIEIEFNDENKTFFVIQPLTFDDSGFYNCNAWNEFGEIHSKFHLSVIDPDKQNHRYDHDHESSIINNDDDKKWPILYICLIIIYAIVILLLLLLIIYLVKLIQIQKLMKTSTNHQNIKNDDAAADDDMEKKQIPFTASLTMNPAVDKSIDENEKNLYPFLNVETFKV